MRRKEQIIDKNGVKIVNPKTAKDLSVKLFCSSASLWAIAFLSLCTVVGLSEIFSIKENIPYTRLFFIVYPISTILYTSIYFWVFNRKFNKVNYYLKENQINLFNLLLDSLLNYVAFITIAIYLIISKADGDLITSVLRVFNPIVSAKDLLILSIVPILFSLKLHYKLLKVRQIKRIKK